MSPWSPPPGPSGGKVGPPIYGGPPRRRRPKVDMEWLYRLSDKDFWAEIDRILSEGNRYTPSNKPRGNAPGQR